MPATISASAAATLGEVQGDAARGALQLIQQVAVVLGDHAEERGELADELEGDFVGDEHGVAPVCEGGYLPPCGRAAGVAGGRNDPTSAHGPCLAPPRTLEVTPPLTSAAAPCPTTTARVQRAASSVALNLAESRGRAGGDRRRHIQIAAGSAFEVQGALDVAAAWGWEVDTRDVKPVLDRLIGLLWGLRR
ncbi:MAG: four helix bundle protein [Kofleriaceae bacterium]|nr:MAG: four helix bundle protein [Kofleriaceae bacterium]KAB2911603.1 MAG: four helix bundle protein [Kofleriaceae bacterium]